MTRTILAMSILLLMGANGLMALDLGKPVTVAQADPAARSDETAKKRAAPVTSEQEIIVEQFVREHHRELAALLIHLKQHRNNEYQRAVRDLHRTYERLEPYRTRDPERFELELKLWQAQSRSQLLAARITMSEEVQLRDQLREALEEQQQLRLTLLRRERERLSDRVGKLDEQIARLEKDRQQTVDRQLAALLAGTREGASQQKNTKSGNNGPQRKAPERKEKP
jgi:hypothetical protein